MSMEEHKQTQINTSKQTFNIILIGSKFLKNLIVIVKVRVLVIMVVLGKIQKVVCINISISKHHSYSKGSSNSISNSMSKGSSQSNILQNVVVVVVELIY